VSLGVDSTTLTSGFFVLAAFFEAALLTFLRAAVLAVMLFTGIALMPAGLLAFSRVASRSFLRRAALLTCSRANVTLLHSLIAITIVCHTCSSPSVDELKVMG
jgi:hypothetical protein